MKPPRTPDKKAQPSLDDKKKKSQSSGGLSDRVTSVGIYFFATMFTRKLNAIGISNIPEVLQTFREAKLSEQKLTKFYKFAMTLFQSAVVFSGLQGMWPNLIRLNAILYIAQCVKQSVGARKTSAEEAKRLTEEGKPLSQQRSSLSGQLKQCWRKNKLFVAKEQTAPKKDDDKKLWQLEKAKALLEGKRDSAFDDVLWGVVQASLLFFDTSHLQAIGHAWLLFLIRACQETVLNDELTWKQKRLKLISLTVTAYLSGKLVF
jgi:hypothetical protein